ncbi:MAG: hypothetical protein ABL921_23020 [Pirellula sp.]
MTGRAWSSSSSQQVAFTYRCKIDPVPLERSTGNFGNWAILAAAMAIIDAVDA